MFDALNKTVIVTGHYGSGKTNFSLNLAMDLRASGKEVSIADLDVVNPYFRTSDFREMAEKNGIELIASDYAGSSLDIPALSGRLDGRLGGDGFLIIDVGGDDTGAVALGRYAQKLSKTGYSMLYIVNAYRYLVREPEESVELLKEIEHSSRLRATHIVNNSNLGISTTAKEIRDSIPYAGKLSQLTALPVLWTVARREIAPALCDIQDLYPANIYVTAPWN